MSVTDNKRWSPQLWWYNFAVSLGVFWYVWEKDNFWTGILYFFFWEIAIGYRFAKWMGL